MARTMTVSLDPASRSSQRISHSSVSVSTEIAQHPMFWKCRRRQRISVGSDSRRSNVLLIRPRRFTRVGVASSSSSMSSACSEKTRTAMGSGTYTRGEFERSLVVRRSGCALLSAMLVINAVSIMSFCSVREITVAGSRTIVPSAWECTRYWLNVAILPKLTRPRACTVTTTGSLIPLIVPGGLNPRKGLAPRFNGILYIHWRARVRLRTRSDTSLSRSADWRSIRCERLT